MVRILIKVKEGHNISNGQQEVREALWVIWRTELKNI